MPPTDFCKLRFFDVRARTTTLVPRWDRGLDHVPVLTRKRPLPCGSGSERRAVHPSSLDDPAAGSSPLRGFARLRYRRGRATTERVSPPVCSDDRRARVRGPSEGCVFLGREKRFCNRSRVQCVRLERSHADDIPLLGALRTSACRRCARPRERKLPQTTWTDRGSRSAGAPRRVPASRKPGCLPPPRSALCPQAYACARYRDDLPLTPPNTFSPGWGKVI
jgi:hypothetical protein